MPLPIVKHSLRRDRYYPQTDRYEGLKRAKSAVVLFSPPPYMFVSGQTGMVPVPDVRLQPVVCSVKGKLEVGARCGEIMPSTTNVRPTGDRDRDIRVTRSTQPFVDEEGGQTYPAPFGPACCMYNTCSGRTIPYFGKPTAAGGGRVFPTQTLLAVWPANADVDLEAHVPHVGRDERIDPALWRKYDKVPDLVQVLNIDGRKYVSATRGHTSGLLFVKAATGWKDISERSSWEHYVIASFDVNEDGQQEVLVLTTWANDYGLSVYVNGAEKPIYRFSCGNV